jgi:hypothetical protein
MSKYIGWYSRPVAWSTFNDPFWKTNQGLILNDLPPYSLHGFDKPSAYNAIKAWDEFSDSTDFGDLIYTVAYHYIKDLKRPLTESERAYFVTTYQSAKGAKTANDRNAVLSSVANFVSTAGANDTYEALQYAQNRHRIQFNLPVPVTPPAQYIQPNTTGLAQTEQNRLARLMSNKLKTASKFDLSQKEMIYLAFGSASALALAYYIRSRSK